MKSRALKASLQIATVVVLLFGIAALSTLAKNSVYFPKSNPTRYVNIASKMKRASSPVVLEREPPYPVAKVRRCPRERHPRTTAERQRQVLRCFARSEGRSSLAHG